MSTTINTSSSLVRPYIGVRRIRDYLNKHSTSSSSSSSLRNDYLFSTTSPLESFVSNQSEESNSRPKTDTTDVDQIEQEKQASVKHSSSLTPADEQQQEQKAEGFLPSTSPSSSTLPTSLFLFPTTHDVVPLVEYESHSLPSYIKEQQHFYHPSHRYEQDTYWQPLNRENKNNQLTLLDESEHQRGKEQQTQKQSYPHALAVRQPNLDLSDVPEETCSFSTSSSYSLSDTIAEEDNNSDNRSHLFTSTPIPQSSSSPRPTTSGNIFPTLLPDRNNHNKPLPLTSDSINDQSSTISTVGLITDLQRKADLCQLNNMSSLSSPLRYSSNVGTGLIALHPYDQRISDQGNKYIIQLKTDEYQEDEFVVTPRYSTNQLIIDAKHREEDSSGGYIHRELHKIFNIPKHIDLNRPIHSYNKHTQEFSIEMPYLQTLSVANGPPFIPPKQTTTEPLLSHSKTREEYLTPASSTRLDSQNDSNNTSGIGSTATDSTLFRSSHTAAPTYEATTLNTKPFDFDLFHRSAFRPQIVRTTANDPNATTEKKLQMSLDLSDYQPEDIKVSVKDRELIVQAERKVETGTRKSRSSFFQSTTLPPQTDVEQLQSNYIEGKLVIEAPYIDQNDPRMKSINNGSIQGGQWQTVTESQQKTSIDDPFQQRTETTIEFIRRRRI